MTPSEKFKTGYLVFKGLADLGFMAGVFLWGQLCREILKRRHPESCCGKYVHRTTSLYYPVGGSDSAEIKCCECSRREMGIPHTWGARVGRGSFVVLEHDCRPRGFFQWNTCLVEKALRSFDQRINMYTQ